MRKKTIAIDFDGTIVECKYPDIGELRKDAKETINKLYDEGYIIIINSCRSAMYEAGIYKTLKENDIDYDYINCNHPSSIEAFGMDCRKISADIYIDDKNLGGIPDWKTIYEIVKKQLRD